MQRESFRQVRIRVQAARGVSAFDTLSETLQGPE
jgi:hypothetical protein